MEKHPTGIHTKQRFVNDTEVSATPGISWTKLFPVSGPMYSKVTYDKMSQSSFFFYFAVIFAITLFYDFYLWCDIFTCYDFEFNSK